MNIILLSTVVSFLFCQDIFTEYLVQDQDTIDVFSYQIPDLYNDEEMHPLLVAFHQWGGNENSTYYTTFDEEANSRNWIFLSPFGGSSNNYNHQGAQEMVKNEIVWLMENFSIDSTRIYMVGGSMGGAAGMIFNNNHLNPNEPMVAATASASGILDCERRAIEMDGNNSMIEWFGGDWTEVPFEYHRNSAIYFEDFSQSMHYNLQHIPVYLDFGESEPHRIHAEEMYDVLLGYNHNMWIDTIPLGSHGFSVIDEEHVCDWMSQFVLVDNPNNISVNLDEPSRSYWVEAANQVDTLNFINIDINRTEEGIDIYNFSNSDTLILHILNQNFENYLINIENSINKLGLSGVLSNNLQYINIEDENGLSLEYTMHDNIIWLSYFGLPPYELPLQGSFTMNILFEEQIEGDVNQDGSCNIQDIILMIGYILGNQNLSEIQIDIADLNNDESIDIMDIILSIAIIIG